MRAAADSRGRGFLVRAAGAVFPAPAARLPSRADSGALRAAFERAGAGEVRFAFDAGDTGSRLYWVEVGVQPASSLRYARPVPA